MNILSRFRPVHLLYVGIVLALSCAFFFWQSRQPAQNPDPNHTHADFAVWIEGKHVDFGDKKYMSDHDDLGGHVQQDKYLHFHDNNPNVVHRHKPGLTIGEFLQSLGWKKEGACIVDDKTQQRCDAADKKWRMIVNGQEKPFDWAYDFADGDQILFSYDTADADLAGQIDELTDQACLYSRTCPWRGEPPVEGCVSDIDVPCTEVK